MPLWRILFDHHDVISSAIHKGLRHMPLGQECIHRAHPAR
jgi:hypothetical protein